MLAPDLQSFLTSAACPPAAATNKEVVQPAVIAFNSAPNLHRTSHAGRQAEGHGLNKQFEDWETSGSRGDVQGRCPITLLKIHIRSILNQTLHNIHNPDFTRHQQWTDTRAIHSVDIHTCEPWMTLWGLRSEA